MRPFFFFSSDRESSPRACPVGRSGPLFRDVETACSWIPILGSGPKSLILKEITALHFPVVGHDGLSRSGATRVEDDGAPAVGKIGDTSKAGTGSAPESTVTGNVSEAVRPNESVTVKRTG